MPAIQVTWEEIGERGEHIRQMLQPIAKREGGPAWQPKSTSTEYIIGTHDGSPPQSDYREWRFPTVVSNFRGMYFERWIQYDEFLYLDRAYLSLFRTDPSTRNETEFLCLHCDPNEPDDNPHAIYKQGPHLHVEAGEEPLPRAHIALNRGHLEVVLSSASSLSKAMYQAIRMIREEILDALN